MMENSSKSPSIIISDAGFIIRITRTGPPAFGFPAYIDLNAGALSGAVSDEIVGAKEFLQNLKVMHTSLAGSASLGGLDGQFDLTLMTEKLGKVSVSASATASYDPKARLEMAFLIDQSYLPPIIFQVEQFMR